MAGTKRAADDSAAGRTTRSSKVPKTSAASESKGKKGKKAAKAAIPASSFKAKALPLHVNVTHTPPAIVEAEDAAHMDKGLIGTLTLVPDSFSTGSYGWKGSKRITVELQDSEGTEGEKEKVQVMLTINATVVGSKNAADDETGEAKAPEAQEDPVNEDKEEEED